jgi:ABC-type sugar transport system ATPase subunit
MTDIAIRVENLSKQYRIGGPQARYKTIRESLTEAVQAPFRRLSSVVRGQSSTVSNETIWALKDVSFEVQRGEVVGIPSTGSGQALAATGRGRRRCSRFCPASPSRRRGTLSLSETADSQAGGLLGNNNCRRRY